MIAFTVMKSSDTKVEADYEGRYRLFSSAYHAVKYMDARGMNPEEWDVVPINAEFSSIGG